MNRLKFIDVAKELGILLMVFNHFEYNNFMIQRFIASFHMPLFFFLSGYVFWNSKWNTKNIPSYIFNRFLQLMIPYFIFCFMWQTEISIKSAITVLYGYTNIGPLWFLPCMFIASTVFFIQNKFFFSIFNINLFFTLIPAILNFAIGILLLFLKKDLPFNIANAFIGAGYMQLGIFCYRTIQHLPKVKDNIFFLILFTITLYIVVFFLSNKNFAVCNLPAKRAVMATGDYGNLLNFIPVSILGCLATLSLSKVLQNSKVLSYIGINTITILVIHYYYPKLIFDKLISYTSIPNGSIIIPITGTTFVIALCLPIAWLFSKFIPTLIGKKSLEN